MINECVATFGMRSGKGSITAQRNQPQYQFIYHKSHMTCPEIKSMMPW
jgi:hypothetical protein